MSPVRLRLRARRCVRSMPVEIAHWAGSRPGIRLALWRHRPRALRWLTLALSIACVSILLAGYGVGESAVPWAAARRIGEGIDRCTEARFARSR